VLDFGLAVGRAIGEPITGAGTVGTPGYLVPEQVLGHRADARSDLYAAGVMLFEALAGRQPHMERDHADLYTAALVDAAPGLASVVGGVPRKVARVIDRLLQSDPTLRYSSADTVLSDLAELTPDPAPSGAVPWLGGDGTVDRVVQRLLADGRPNEAMALLQLALPAARELVDGKAEAAMLDALLRVALALEQVEALDDWLYHHSRATKAATRHLRPALALARAVAASMCSRDEARLCDVLAVPPMGDVEFDAARWRHWP
jgi:hypothetical protein